MGLKFIPLYHISPITNVKALSWSFVYWTNTWGHLQIVFDRVYHIVPDLCQMSHGEQTHRRPDSARSPLCALSCMQAALRSSQQLICTPSKLMGRQMRGSERRRDNLTVWEHCVCHRGEHSQDEMLPDMAAWRTFQFQAECFRPESSLSADWSKRKNIDILMEIFGAEPSPPCPTCWLSLFLFRLVYCQIYPEHQTLTKQSWSESSGSNSRKF